MRIFPSIIVGFQKDICGCCTICANSKGERCSGPFEAFGRCGRGLTCVKRRFPPPDFNTSGICRPNKVSLEKHSTASFIDKF